MGVARRAGEITAAREAFVLSQRAGLRETAPALHDAEGGQRHEPDIRFPKCIGPHRHRAENTNDGGDEKAVARADKEPQNGTEDLAAVERVNRQKIEYQQCEIDRCDRIEEVIQIRV
jgi:hypothetical protein